MCLKLQDFYSHTITQLSGVQFVLSIWNKTSKRIAIISQSLFFDPVTKPLDTISGN